jgi:predicted transcriptional regulator
MIKALAVVIKLLSNQKSLDLFNTIAREEGINRSESLRVKLNLTKKPYYQRMSALVRSGLVMKKQDQKYYLTAFGHIICQVLLTMDGAVKEYWKLKAVDSLNNIPAREREIIIDSMINNEQIKELLYRTINHTSVSDM